MGSYDSTFLVLAQAVTPVHAGVGGRGHIVDLPVQRDFAGYPCIWGSSFKGALRSVLEQRHHQDRNALNIIEYIFGPHQDRAHEFGGCVVFGDLKLLAIPGPCGAGICYFTSPLLLNYLREFAEIANIDGNIKNIVREVADSVARLRGFAVSSNECLVDQSLIIGSVIVESVETILIELRDLFQVILERLGMSRELVTWLSERIVVAPEVRARELIGRKLLQCVTRVALDYRTKTVRPRALWSEEYVPEFTIFSGLMLAGKPRRDIGASILGNGASVVKKLVELMGGELDGDVARIYTVLGGHETIGKGIMRIAITGKFS